MIIIYTNQRSKKRKSKTKKQIAEYESWINKINSMTTNFSSDKKTQKENKFKTLRRETSWRPSDSNKKYPSLNSFHGTCTKPIHGKVYTGTAMVGIGTLHKSNAVPIFNIEDAQDQAKMRR